ncbi:hypothetical protein [Spirillospora sp. CA-294931]|uniref:hypothetical protein n=1 Tax=Spirillospora sp. CA-294931 TaxID=3240042 RepID=UPI003D90C1EC
MNVEPEGGAQNEVGGSAAVVYNVSGEAVTVSVGTSQSAVEFAAALDRAEGLLQQVDRNRLLIGVVYAVQIAVFSAFVAAAMVMFHFSGGTEVALMVGAVTSMAGGGLVAVLLQTRLLRPLFSQLRRDQAAMVDAVNALREQLGSVASEAQWSNSTARLSRLRIERFPL